MLLRYEVRVQLADDAAALVRAHRPAVDRLLSPRVLLWRLFADRTDASDRHASLNDHAVGRQDF